MSSVCLYFQVHQPNRLKNYSFFEIGNDHFYENDSLNAEIVNKIADKCYIPANALMMKLIKKYNGKFKIAFSISGVALEQFKYHRPDVLKSFVELARTGCVEFLSETYYHSLSYFYSKEEFKRQVKMHRDIIWKYFDQKPVVFRNTELLYNNELAKFMESLGYKGIIAEGVDWHLNGRTPNVLYRAPNVGKIKTLLRNYKLSDDIGFRFTNKEWAGYPLTATKYANWLAESGGDVINAFIDYESIGEHHWADTGIFKFFEELPEKIFSHKKLNFVTPSEAVSQNKVKGIFDSHSATSWADHERDLSAWTGNSMQSEALKKIYELEKLVKTTRNQDLTHVWSKLQTSDHFYYMSTKGSSDGEVHDYFSPYNSPYNGYIFYMNAVSDLEITLKTRNRQGKTNQDSLIRTLKKIEKDLKSEVGHRGRPLEKQTERF